MLSFSSPLLILSLTMTLEQSPDPEVVAELAAEFRSGKPLDWLERSEQDYLGECNKNRLLAAAECFAHAAIRRRSAQGIRAERILRKMGCNLTVQRKNRRFVFLDMLTVECPDRNGKEAREDGLLALYGEIEKAVEICSSLEGSRTITVMIDDVSLIEVAANGSSNHVLDFLHYCYTLKAKYGCSFVTLNHEDIYSSANTLPLILQPEYLADVIIKAEPLATGLASDVHGQLTVLNKGSVYDLGGSSSKVRNFHFRVKENTVDYFYPGTQT